MLFRFFSIERLKMRKALFFFFLKILSVKVTVQDGLNLPKTFYFIIEEGINLHRVIQVALNQYNQYLAPIRRFPDNLLTMESNLNCFVNGEFRYRLLWKMRKSTNNDTILIQRATK